MKNEVGEKLEILQKLYKSDFLHPFPYEDCRKITRQTANQNDDLVACLDVYFSDVAGFCSWGKRMEKWSAEKTTDTEIRLNKSFFDRFPKLSEFKSKINEQETPTLYNQLLIFDLMRLTLMDILSEMKFVRRFQVKKKAEVSLGS